MAEPPVVNASPLIFLSTIGRLDLLRGSNTKVMVPLRVVQEIQRFGPIDPTVQALAQTSWLEAVDPGPSLPILQGSKLGGGEAAVITYALAHPPAEAILDDLAARRCALALGLPVRGTLGLVISAKQRGVIQQARPILEALCQSGLYLSERVLNQALVLVGE